MNFIEDASSIPSQVLGLPGALSALYPHLVPTATGSVVSSAAAQIIASASTHQQAASQQRLSLPRAPGPAQTKHQNKSLAILQDKKAVKERILAVGRIKIAAGIWEFKPAPTAKKRQMGDVQGKMTANSQIRIAGAYEPTMRAKNALDDLLGQVMEIHIKMYPDALKLTWDNVQLYAHETVSVYAILDHARWLNNNVTVQDLYNKFVTSGWLSKANIDANKIEVRYAYIRENIFPPVWVIDSDDDESESYVPSSKKPRVRKAGPSGILPSASVRSTSSIIQHSKPILRSAFRAPKPVQVVQQYTRDPPMAKYSFYRTTAVCSKSGDVTMTPSQTLETIEIPEDWAKGERLYDANNEAWLGTGYIGKGYTKRAIYVRIDGTEYALSQIREDNDNKADAEAEVKYLLEAEYQALCKLDYFKQHFDNHAKENEVNVPSFCVNFKGSFLGQLHLTTESKSSHLPFHHFLATKLLPCGKVDGKLRRFTGNDEIGKIVDHLDQAVHAFAHFIVVYSGRYIVMCDLQGINDNNGVMTLIDPQYHSSAPSNTTPYWDHGSSYIDRFLTQHKSQCQSNKYCTALALATTEVTHDSSGSPEAPQRHKSERKKPLRTGWP
ncbi:hypothetical protein BJ138DRAFT_1127442 [Hygrophoropsis aurantiaca]|uniref:Uncharacterized protein n=1 Tax=Hygrophoropsis aurantiaca TaxID=72124 RepID=A0ACB8A9H5_9AGAM|nr:hypothetical protein BJ138DRAFT_1127442 [Hygrophoropsis aurantiaca]